MGRQKHVEKESLKYHLTLAPYVIECFCKYMNKRKSLYYLKLIGKHGKTYTAACYLLLVYLLKENSSIPIGAITIFH